MKKCLIKKLNQSQGASLMLALLVFLICAMCGSVVLAAGTAAAGRIAGLKESDQSLYTLTSAAGAIGDELRTARYTYDSDNAALTEVTPKSSIMAGTLEYLCSMIADGNDSATKNVTLTAAGSDLLSDEVNADITMDSKYSIQAVFTMNDSRTAVILTSAGVPYVDSQYETEDSPKSMTWADPEITVGDSR
ncbi:MAG: hypothetical protein EOM64_00235 [Erysipelotrichia bacterium]|nr:hypothetical protein [Erysipelotrichia bacterium]